MRGPKPYFPSISFVLSQAQVQRLTQYPTRCSQHKTLLPPVHDNLMQTVDERDYISHLGLDPFFEHNNELINLREALVTEEDDGSIAKGRRLSLSSLVIDLALAVRRKYQQLCVKRRESEVDCSVLA